MILPALNLTQALLAILIVSAGTMLQASIGFGLALIAAPLLILVDRAFVPGPLLVVALCLTTFMLIREHHAIDLSGFKAALAGRLIGTPPAAWMVGSFSTTAFDILFGSLVLAAVGLSLIHRNIKPTPRSVFFAAIASGFMSTVSSIGGPPLALIYQNSRGPELRATLAALFTAGCIISLTALGLVGKFGMADLARSGILIIGILIGLLLARPFVRILDRHAARPYVLGLSSIAATIVLIRVFIQTN